MRVLCALALLGTALCPTRAAASEIATSAVTVHVEVCSRTSLRVSSDRLRFTVVDDEGSASADVDFTAAGRVPPGADLVLTVEALPGGLRDEAGSVTLGSSRTLVPAQPAVAARWQGSGTRSGRLVFALRGADRGVHELPVRFVLSTP